MLNQACPRKSNDPKAVPIVGHLNAQKTFEPRRKDGSLCRSQIIMRFLEKIQNSFAEIKWKLQSVFKIGPESSVRIRRRQFLMGVCLVLESSIFVYAVMNVLGSQGTVPRQEVTPKPITTNIATATKQYPKKV